jgi:heme-degrading monooxygenase HmoA
MFVVIFLVEPKPERFGDYLDLAKYLKPQLEAIDGFIDNERFESRRRKGRVLSLSTWRDEKAVIRWRTQGEHHGVQEKGRFEIFQDYGLSVGEVTDDSDPPQGLRVEEQHFDMTEAGAGKVATVTEITPAKEGALEAAHDLPAQLGLATSRDGLLDAEAFASIYVPGKLLLLGRWRDAAAKAWNPRHPVGAGTVRHRRVRIIRDYGMFDRREAPQYYPSAANPKFAPQLPRVRLRTSGSKRH